MNDSEMPIRTDDRFQDFMILQEEKNKKIWTTPHIEVTLVIA